MDELETKTKMFCEHFQTMLGNDMDFIFIGPTGDKNNKIMTDFFKQAIKVGYIDFSVIRKNKYMENFDKSFREYMSVGIAEKHKLMCENLQVCWEIWLSILETLSEMNGDEFPFSTDTLLEMFKIYDRLQKFEYMIDDDDIDSYEYLFFKAYSLIEKLGVEYADDLTKKTASTFLKNQKDIDIFYADVLRDQFFNAWTRKEKKDANNVMYFEFQSLDKIKILWKEFIPMEVYESTIYKLIRTQRNENTHSLNLRTKFSDGNVAVSKQQLVEFTKICLIILMYLVINIASNETSDTSN
jgi:hypothetical protein